MVFNSIAPKITILGSNGYIGTNLIDKLQNKAELQLVSRNNSEKMTFSEKDLNVIINLCSSKISDEHAISYESNFNFQRKILMENEKKRFLWIQIASYYELQIVHGRSDSYSTHKTEFRKFLNEWEIEHKEFTYKCLFLPHVFGRNESRDRLISSLKQLNLGKKTVFGSKDQYIPILYIDDAIAAILLAIDASQKISMATPIWYGKLNELVRVTVKDESVCELSVFQENKQEFSSVKINFPQPLVGFNPLFTFYELQHKLKEGIQF
jgi:nucleoside-diphosphate-sugar epimerase